MTYEVVTAADAEGMFDILTYEKGAAVLRMLEQYLGAEVFRAGVGHYLRTHAYGNTETSDLWDAIAKGDFPEYELGLQVFDEATANLLALGKRPR